MSRTLFAVLCLAPACSTTGSEAEELPIEDSVRVVVVDEQGALVPDAEVRGPGRADVAMSATEAIFSGRLGLIDRYAKAVRADDDAAARVGDPGDEHWVVACDGERWGAVRGARAAGSDDVVVTLHRDEMQRVRCVDTDRRPATGALIWVWLKGESNQVEWGQFVTAADGTLDVPHAQHWRALRAAGHDVRLGALVMWSDAMLENQLGDVAFPDMGGALEFVVEPSGWIDVRIDERARGAATLRWPDGADPEDPEDVPEMPFEVDRASPMSWPLGLRLELVVEVPGAIDPRVAFDGPKSAGEHVQVVVPAPQPAWTFTGRFVDASGAALADRRFDAWIDSGAERIEPEEGGWELSSDDGRFAIDFAVAPTGPLHFEVEPTSGWVATVTLGGEMRPGRPAAQRDVASNAQRGIVDLGDVVCVEPPR